VRSASGAGAVARAAVACLLGLALSACASGAGLRAEPLRVHENLNAMLWLQDSAEYRANALQAFAAARAQLDRALDDPTWTGAAEQTGDFAGLPPAIVLDMDEAIVRSDRFQAGLVKKGEPFRTADWNAWVHTETAEAMPGALAYVRHARERGVQIFYVTNRLAAVEAASLATLRKAGFPVEGGADQVLAQDERPDWTSDKTSRRAFLCRSHRVLQIVGDNLNDFSGGTGGTLDERRALVEEHASWWGSRWIVLPNPAYGSWEGALYGYDQALPRSEILRRKYEQLDSWR
jgi:acid phosphatase